MLRRIGISFFLVMVVAHSFATEWHKRADEYWNRALKLKNERKYEKAIEMFKHAVNAERMNNNPRSKELCSQLSQIAQIYDILGNYHKSLHYYSMMLKVADEYADRENQILALDSKGKTYYNLVRYDEAVTQFKMALKIAENIGKSDKVLLVLNNLAKAYRAKGDFDRALAQYERALSVAHKSGANTNESILVSNIGTLQFFKGNYRKALKFYNRAYSLDRSQDVDTFISVDLSNIGSVYSAIGQYEKAMDNFQKALEIDRRLGIEVNIAARLNSIGDVYFRTGNTGKAIECYMGSLEINRKLKNKINSARLLYQIGEVYDSIGKYNEALDYYIKAIEINKKIEIKENIIHRLSDIGTIYETRDRHNEAVDFLSKAFLQNMMVEKKNKIAANMSSIGRVMISLKKYDRALNFLNQSVEQYQEIGDSLSAADDLKYIGIVYYSTKRYGDAAVHFKKALDMLEKVREKNDPRFIAVENDLYRWLIEVNVKSGKHEEAFLFSEIFSMKRAHYCFSQGVKNKRTLPDRIIPMRNEIDDNSMFLVFMNSMWDNPVQLLVGKNGSRSFELPKVETVKSIYNTLGKDIEKLIAKEGVDVRFNIKKKSRKDHYFIEFQKIIIYYRALSSKKYINNDEMKVLQYLSKKLYKFLFKKIEDSLAGKRDLIIKADGILSLFPFESLITPDGRYLVEKYRIRYHFSNTLSELGSQRKYSSSRSSVLSIPMPLREGGAPAKEKIESARHFNLIINRSISRLINSEPVGSVYRYFNDSRNQDRSLLKKESEIFGAWNPGSKLINPEEVSEAKLKTIARGGILNNFKIIHLTSPVMILPEVPELSALVLDKNSNEKTKEDGYITTREISDLPIRADLVSATNVSIPKIGYNRGEGTWNLCASFFAAGARGVTLSLWPVEDDSRILFFKNVYALIEETGVSAYQAINETKISFIRGSLSAHDEDDKSILTPERMKKYANPYFWASFVYYGE